MTFPWPLTQSASFAFPNTWVHREVTNIHCFRAGLLCFLHLDINVFFSQLQIQSILSCAAVNKELSLTASLKLTASSVTVHTTTESPVHPCSQPRALIQPGLTQSDLNLSLTPQTRLRLLAWAASFSVTENLWSPDLKIGRKVMTFYEYG